MPMYGTITQITDCGNEKGEVHMAMLLGYERIHEREEESSKSLQVMYWEAHQG